MRKISVILLLICILCLSGCQSSGTTSRRDLSSLISIAVTRGANLGNAADANSLVLNETIPEPIYDILRLPEGAKPLGQLSKQEGFIRSADEQVLYLWDYSLATGTIIQSLSDGWLIDSIFALNSFSCVWLEYSPLIEENGRWQREYIMRVYDIQGSKEIVRAKVTAAEGSFRPLDNIVMSETHLVYRFSTFINGWRDSEVMLYDLISGETQSLFKSMGNGGSIINRCFIQDSLVSWDVQTLRGTIFSDAFYDLYVYQLDQSKLARNEDPLKRITSNLGYHSPIIQRNFIYALKNLPYEVGNHTSLRSEVVAIDPAMLTSQRIIHADVLIYRLDPMYSDEIIDYANAGINLHPEETEGIMWRYDLKGLNRTVLLDDLFIGERYLSWQSNVEDQHVFFDLDYFGIYLMPLFFEDDVGPREYNKQGIVSVKGDFIYFTSATEAYILSIS